LDSHTFFGDNDLSQGNDSFLLRRARPILEGTVFRDFDFQFIPDFGGSSVQIFDASLNYRFRPELQFKAGKFKSPVGLEQLQVDADVAFNERSLATDLVPNRSVGVEVWGDIGEGALTYAAGIFNNTGDGRHSGNVDFTDDKEFAGRVFGRPFKESGPAWLRGLGIGVSGSYSQVSSNSAALPSTTGGSLPGYASAGQQQFFAFNPVVGPVVADGTHWRVSPQAYYYYGPFGLMGEYVISDQGVLNSANLRKANLQAQAWQIQAQYVLTGEDATFGTLIPNRPFTWHGGGWGAWQLVGRYGELSIDDDAFPNFANPATSAKGATEWAVGINWWLNRNLRVLTSFSHTDFDGGGMVNLADPASRSAPATVTHQSENALFTRLQLSF
jgi:phosphate-selective porin OprO/OprP